MTGDVVAAIAVKGPAGLWRLRYLLREVADHGCVAVQSYLVRVLVLPHMGGSGPQVYLAEVVIGFSFLLGLATLATAFVGLVMAVNLWLGLYNTPKEWPWTHGYLIIIQFLFVLDPPGRTLGVDVWLRRWGRLPGWVG